MKATIDAKGMLTIESETPLESYALQKWCNDHLQTMCRDILIKHAAGHDGN